MDLLIRIGALGISIIIGFVVGFFFRKYIIDSKLSSAEQKANLMLNNAKKEAQTLKKEVLLEGKEEIQNLKIHAEDEIKKQRLDEILGKEILRLEAIAELTKEEAKAILIKKIEEEARYESAKEIRNIEPKLKEEADTMAKKIISQAIQRCALDHVSETTVSVVNLPNDEMKGRIIGREGRNIRVFENLTGINIIVDDTPEAVILSSFDAGISELNPGITKVLGRLKYRTSYGQNILLHSKEVAYVAGVIAAELGMNIKKAKRAGLLHDIGKALTHDIEGSHAIIGAELAKRLNEDEEICHAIESHHNEVEANTVLGVIIQAADQISGGRPGARRETLESYVKRLESLEKIATKFKGIEKAYAIQAGREIRVMVKPEEVNEDLSLVLAKEIAKEIEKEMEYPGQIKVTVIRESRAVEYAK